MKQTINSFFLWKLSTAGHLAIDSSIVWPKKDAEILWKKMQQLPNSQCDYLFEHATGDYSKQYRPCLYMVQSYQFQFEIVIEENLYMF